ncbi:dipeptidase [Paenibacillus senegalensis]|uniref:dipeptidase n=1 Tax=Paenibacillus senegalensis TaxID=1465766 RepID=UPI000288E013|nr:dipeptidase [Paenibacillus senegalensis]
MKIIDAHCDLLYKMYLDRSISFTDNKDGVDVTFSRLIDGNIALQWFAIFLPSDPSYHHFDNVLTYIDLYRSRIVNHPQMAMIESRNDWIKALAENKIGAMLSLEGVEGLGGRLEWLRIAAYLGVRSIGITWNPANWAADGVGEPRKGGFTVQGKNLIRECNRLKLMLDVSHLCETAFWELAELSNRPFAATHSNCYSLCPHPRNLTNEQIMYLVRSQGRMGITFVPHFVSERSPDLTRLLHHIDHVCSLGGEHILCFGSDFDGIDNKLPHLEHPGQYQNLVEELEKRYTNQQVQQFLFGNWHTFLLEQLPEE